MRKLLLAITLLAFVPSVYAETIIEIYPARPANCQIWNYPVVNWIYDLNKVSEDKKEVVYEMIVSHGSCRNGEMIPSLVDERMASVGVIRDEMVLPWQKEGAKAQIEQESETEFRIRLTFNKKVLFKKKVEKNLTMFFRPGEKYGPVYWIQRGNMLVPWQADLQFPWHIYLSVDEAFQTHLKISM